MRLRLAAVLLLLLTAASSAQTQGRNPDVPGPIGPVAGLPAPVLLWPAGAPGAKGTSEEDQPAFYPFLPTNDTNTGAAVIVAPGGAFTHRAADYEGVTVARWLRAHGVAAFVLRYRIMPLYTRNDAVTDGLRAVQYLRAHAAEYKISPTRVGMMGFSAGSELAHLAVQRSVAGQPDDGDPVARQSSRLDFMVLAYGAVPAGGPGASVQPQASVTYPPTFLFCTAEDASHLTPMLSLYTALRQANVPTELHVFPVGEHGVGLAAGDRSLGEWPDLMLTWLRANTLLTDATRAAVRGRIRVDGAPLPHGSITFVPIDGQSPRGAPPVTAYVMNTDTPDAEYKLEAARGPVPGKYKVEVRQDAVVWVSNNRDPAKRLPAAEREAFIRRPGWGAPTIEDIRLFTRQKPGGSELIVDIAPGSNTLDVDVATR